MTINREDLHTVDLSGVTIDGALPNLRPGDVLRADFIGPAGISANALARDISVPPNRITGILNGTRAITAETAIKLGARFGTSAEFWMNLQNAYDLEEAGYTCGAAEATFEGRMNLGVNSKCMPSEAMEGNILQRLDKIERALALLLDAARVKVDTKIV